MNRSGALLHGLVMVGLAGAAFLSTVFTHALAQTGRAPLEGSGVPPDASLQLIEDGRGFYLRRCGACHSLDANRVGPRHRGVWGREAGAVPDFNYTKALRELGVIWNDETLDSWLANPTAFAPGTSMGFRLNSAEERKAIIAYLKSVSPGVQTADDAE